MLHRHRLLVKSLVFCVVFCCCLSFFDLPLLVIFKLFLFRGKNEKLLVLYNRENKLKGGTNPYCNFQSMTSCCTKKLPNRRFVHGTHHNRDPLYVSWKKCFICEWKTNWFLFVQIVWFCLILRFWHLILELSRHCGMFCNFQSMTSCCTKKLPNRRFVHGTHHNRDPLYRIASLLSPYL
jgi:hypothetical protein